MNRVKPKNLEEIAKRRTPIWKRVLSTTFVRKFLSTLDHIGGHAIRTKVGAKLIAIIFPKSRPVLCAECFTDRGLRLDAVRVGIDNALPCPNCGARNSKKLTPYLLEVLASNYFVRGTMHRTKYGAAPILQFNKHHYGEGAYSAPPWLIRDVELIEEKCRIGFFHYGPRLWMVGEVAPLKALEDSVRRDSIIERIMREYPARHWGETDIFYRLRRNPKIPLEPSEYDSPPDTCLGNGRLDAIDFPVLYCSQDVEGCVHECRVTVEDELYIAMLRPSKSLRLLDVTELLLDEEGVTEFESLDMAMHFLFYAAEHSYPISRAIALAARRNGFDGLIYPSYFSQVRSGLTPTETVGYGISVRHAASHFPRLIDYARSGVYPNVALFGRPIRDGIAEIVCINRLILHKAYYDIRFGPVCK
jgi:hypothetical protein